VRARSADLRRRFFVDTFDAGRAVLAGDAAHHLGRVLRAEPGQLYELSDGTSVWLGKIEFADEDEIQFALVEPLPIRTSSLDKTLLLAVVKFDAFEWALEKATELGVSRIVPLVAARSEKALVGAAGKRSERWRKILLESSQQARRVNVPELGDAVRPEEAFAGSGEGLRILLSERADAPGLKGVLSGATDPDAGEAANTEGLNPGPRFKNKTWGTQEEKSGLAQPGAPQQRGPAVILAIGPEGGWTDAELEAARRAGFREASLGGLILRTETAVAAALAALNYATSR